MAGQIKKIGPIFQGTSSVLAYHHPHHHHPSQLYSCCQKRVSLQLLQQTRTTQILKKKLVGGWTNPFQKYTRQKWVNIFPNFRPENNEKNTWNHQPPRKIPKNQMCHLFLRPHPSGDHTSCSASNFINLSSNGNCFASNDVEVLKIWPHSNIAGRRKYRPPFGEIPLELFLSKKSV